MSRTISILCTVLLIVPACDGVETLDDEAPDADIDADDADAEGVDDELVGGGPVAAPGNCATLFEHVFFKGARLEADKKGVKWIGDLWNDQVSSIKVRSGCVLNAYEHINYGGAHKSFVGSVERVGSGWNDKISSFKCSC